MTTQSPSHRFSDYSNHYFEAFIAAFTVLPILALIYFYPALPERIPEYLNFHGEVETWGRKGFASIFRLPMMAIDMQAICLLMKYGLRQGGSFQRVEHAEQYAIYRDESVKLTNRLFNWFRALIAIKFAEASLDVIFFGIERFQFLLSTVRVIPWITAILGIAGATFYGYRLLAVNRKLKEAGNTGIPRQTYKSYLRGGIFYYNSDDPSWFNDKYLLNFANKWVYVFIACLLCLPLLMLWPMLNS